MDRASRGPLIRQRCPGPLRRAGLVPPRRWSALLLAGALAVASAACGAPEQRYPLVSAHPGQPVSGSVQVERIEGGERLVVVELSKLPPPERLASGLRTFAVWLQEEGSAPVLAGTLRYDREQQSGNLMATTPSKAFTLRVTGERQSKPDSPSEMLVAERRVVIN